MSQSRTLKVCLRSNATYILYFQLFLSSHSKDFHFVFPKLNFNVIWQFSNYKIFWIENIYYECLYIKHSIAFYVLWEGTFKMLLNIIVQILSLLDERGQEKGVSTK